MAKLEIKFESCKQFAEFIEQLTINLNSRSGRSAWDNGVNAYMFDFLAHVEESFQFDNNIIVNEKLLLNGADNWQHYSESGCGLCYENRICARLCPPSVQKAKKGGNLNPNKYETWYDVEARALYQAAKKFLKISTRTFNLIAE